MADARKKKAAAKQTGAAAAAAAAAAAGKKVPAPAKSPAAAKAAASATAAAKLKKVSVNPAAVSTSIKQLLDEEEVGELLSDSDRQLLELADSVLAQESATLGKVENLAAKVSSASLRLRRLECRFPATVLWRVANFREQFQDSKAGKIAHICSQKYFTWRYGYCISFQISFNGEGNGRGSHFSIFASLHRTDYDDLLDWPFNMRIYFTLIDQSDDVYGRRNVTKMLIPNICKENLPFIGRPLSEKNPPFGLEEFVSHKQVLQSDRTFVKNNEIFIKVELVSDDLYDFH